MDHGDEIWQRAQELHLQDKWDEAEELYVQLLEQNHDNKGVMATLGSLYVQKGRMGLGIHFLEASINAGLKQADAYTNLGLAYKQTGQIDKARENFELSVKDDPTAQALTNYSSLFIEAGQTDKCISLCEQAIGIEPDLATPHWNLAISLLGEGVWERAWDEHEYGLAAGGLREDRAVVDVPRWDGTSGKTVLVYGEQGLGDELMFASMLPDLLKTNTVVLECHKRLETIFKRSFPGVAVYGTREDKAVSWAHNHKIDSRISIGSLGKFYRRSREAFPGTPYLKAEPLPKGDKFRVGISWVGGGAKVGRVQKRSIPLPWWKSILSVKNVEFVSLQYTDSGGDLDIMDGLGYDIKRMDKEVKAADYYETARLVASCDLVISVCTSVIHLAGALGVPCWVMTPKYPAWRYQNTGGMPWYRSVRLYRSPDTKQEFWVAVVERVAMDLDEMVNAKAQRVA